MLVIQPLTPVMTNNQFWIKTEFSVSVADDLKALKFELGCKKNKKKHRKTNTGHNMVTMAEKVIIYNFLFVLF